MSRERGKMLVIRGGAIGDFILTLPAFAALRDTFQETRIEALGYPNLAELALHGGVIDGYKSIESGPLAAFFGRNAKLNEQWMEYFSSFHLILSFLYDPDLIFQTNVALASKAQFIKGPHRPDERAGLHASLVFLEPLERLAIFDPDPIPRLRLPAKGSSLRSGPKRIAIHPGSGSPRKNWPATAWVELVQAILEKTDWQVVVVGGEAELALAARFGAPGSSNRLQAAFGQPLLATAELIQSCDFFAGHDSGITHLAAALGLPLLALWGPSNFEVWRPVGGEITVLQAGENLPALPVELVFSKLLELVPNATRRTQRGG